MLQARILALLLACAPAAPVAAAQAGYEKLSPFEMVRWEGDEPEVLVAGTWWRLEAIDGIEIRSILARSRELYGDAWAKRFCEDLVELLSLLGHPPGDVAELRLAELDAEASAALRSAAWTAENRRRIRDARPRPASERRAAATIERVERERDPNVPAELEPLARRLAVLEGHGARLSREQAAADLAELEWLVEHTFSYRDRLGVDRRAAFDALHARLGESISRASFALHVHSLLCLFGDGHTRVRLPTAELLAPGALPLRLVRDGHGVVALAAERALPFDLELPYLVAIDGAPIEDWLAAARAIVPRGSDAFVARQALRRTVHVGHLRALLGRPTGSSVRLTLSGREGGAVEHEAALERVPAREPEGERLAARRLAGGVGYLRIGAMEDDPRFLERLEEHLDELAGAPGLVVDVRGNGGGSRRVLLALAPRVMPREIDALVANVAALRVAPGEDRERAGDALVDRFLRPASWSGWSEAARAEVRRTAASFAPGIGLDPREFTDAHYLVLERDATRAPLTEGRVVVLQDGGCFSATDVFLGALAELPNVTLVGTTSGGGSGRARVHALAHSGLAVQLSSMLSFRPDGRAYDGLGVEPDVVVEPTLDDWCGRTDSCLERALELVGAR